MRGKRRLSRRPRQQSSEHPHVCGENRRFCSVWPWDSGTSPRMRGKPFVVVVKNFTQRNIPAYAGKTGRYAQQMSKLTGTSPRMRGKLRPKLGFTRSLRNIPAYAGKTAQAAQAARVAAEHPRVCGENFTMKPRDFFLQGTSPRMRGKPPHGFHATVLLGTSPRMRGKRHRRHYRQQAVRNIPAYAGKTYRPAGGAAIC